LLRITTQPDGRGWAVEFLETTGFGHIVAQPERSNAPSIKSEARADVGEEFMGMGWSWMQGESEQMLKARGWI
jgi:hypothetical protein